MDVEEVQAPLAWTAQLFREASPGATPDVGEGTCGTGVKNLHRWVIPGSRDSANVGQMDGILPIDLDSRSGHRFASV